MSTTSPSARPLSAGLLVSKGAARPAPTLDHRAATGAASSLFDVGSAPRPGSSAHSDSAPHSYSSGHTGAPPAPTSSAAATRETPGQKGKKAAFTFRMDEARHFRLRLLSAHQNRSAQKIMETALDAYLESQAPALGGGACPCFTDEAP